MNALHALRDASLLLAAPLAWIACATVANAILTRVMARRQQRVIRTAIGTSRPDLVRQLLVEDIALSSVAAAVLLLCVWQVDGARAIAAMKQEMTPRSSSTIVDHRRATGCDHRPSPNRLKT